MQSQVRRSRQLGGPGVSAYDGAVGRWGHVAHGRAVAVGLAGPSVTANTLPQTDLSVNYRTALFDIISRHFVSSRSIQADASAIANVIITTSRRSGALPRAWQSSATQGWLNCFGHAAAVRE